MDLSSHRVAWEAPEHSHLPKSIDWHWGVWIVAATIAIASILLGDLMFGILVVIATFTLIVSSSRAPELIEHEVSDAGVRTGNTLYPFATLESFGIDHLTPSYPKLILKSKKSLLPHIIIPLENADSELVRKTLEVYLPNEDLKEPLSHKLLEYVGF